MVGDAVFVRQPYAFGEPRALHRALMLAALGYSDLAIYIIRNIQHLSHLERLKIEKVLSTSTTSYHFRRFT